MIVKVDTIAALRQFVFFVKRLYRDDPHYVMPLFAILMRELRREVLQTGKYTAIMALRDGKVAGRLLYTREHSKERGEAIFYFSFFDAINDQQVANDLFQHMESDMREAKIKYAEGTFTPYDPDTRRGVLIEGFDLDPTIFTSYNYPYYQTLLEGCGFGKSIDTYSLAVDIGPKSGKVLSSLSAFFYRRHNVSVKPIDFRHLETEMSDIHHIFQTASSDLNYQEAPSMEMIRNVAENMRLFIHPDFIQIARNQESGEAIGFCLALPDFNQVFKKTKGRIRPLRFILEKRRITRVRGILQYVVPEYQSTGLVGCLFAAIYDNFAKHGITEFEAGTMLETNVKPIQVFNKLGGRISKIYRIYGKEID